MNILHDLSLGKPPGQLNVFIEIAKGSANKYELDKETGLLFLDRVLHSSYVYPMNYGLVPQTHWHDGDSLDALVMSTHPFIPGSVISSRPIALLRMVDDGDQDEKLVCVPTDDPRFADHQDLKDIDKHTQAELVNFFETYKILQKKTVTVQGLEGRAAAAKVIAEAVALYKEKYKNSR